MKEKQELLRQAARLVTLGYQVENCRGKVKCLIERGAAYDAPELVQAVKEFEKADYEWKELEKQHFLLREQLTNGKGTTAIMK